jgi:hypothetical protein
MSIPFGHRRSGRPKHWIYVALTFTPGETKRILACLNMTYVIHRDGRYSHTFIFEAEPGNDRAALRVILDRLFHQDDKESMMEQAGIRKRAKKVRVKVTTRPFRDLPLFPGAHPNPRSS